MFTSMGILVVATSVLISLLPVQSADAAGKQTSFTPDALRANCRFQGGTFYPPSPECGGCYGCILPNGDVIHCTSDGTCDILDRQIGGNLLKFMTALELSLQQRPQGPADLVPLLIPASVAPEGFCRRNDQGDLLLKIYNQGGTDAIASTTRVVFAPGDLEQTATVVDIDTPALAATTGNDLSPIPIPESCWDAANSCRFTIGVDVGDAVLESNVTNNNAAGLCGAFLQ